MIVRLTDLGVTLGAGGSAATVIHDINLEVQPGEIVMLRGRSGSGKTTLLNVLSGWSTPSVGEIEWNEDIRPDHWDDVAIIPQALGLLADLTIAENVRLPSLVGGGEQQDLMVYLGIAHLAERMIDQVSLGEQQRASVARALVLSPRLVIADEPAAHQDHDRLELVWDAFRRAADGGAAVVVASHHPDTAAYADRVLQMESGTLT